LGCSYLNSPGKEPKKVSKKHVQKTLVGVRTTGLERKVHQYVEPGLTKENTPFRQGSEDPGTTGYPAKRGDETKRVQELGAPQTAILQRNSENRPKRISLRHDSSRQSVFPGALKKQERGRELGFYLFEGILKGSGDHCPAGPQKLRIGRAKAVYWSNVIK